MPPINEVCVAGVIEEPVELRYAPDGRGILSFVLRVGVLPRTKRQKPCPSAKCTVMVSGRRAKTYLTSGAIARGAHVVVEGSLVEGPSLPNGSEGALQVCATGVLSRSSPLARGGRRPKRVEDVEIAAANVEMAIRPVTTLLRSAFRRLPSSESARLFSLALAPLLRTWNQARRDRRKRGDDLWPGVNAAPFVRVPIAEGNSGRRRVGTMM